MAKKEALWADKIAAFEEHMNVLRSAFRTEDTRLISVASVRMALACLQLAVLPVFADDSRDEWKRGPAMAFAKWLNGEHVDSSEFKK